MGVVLKGKSGTNYIFEGPYKLKSSLENNPGVCAVISETYESFKLLDLLSSNGVLESMIQKKDVTHDDVSECSSDFGYAAFYIWSEKTSEYITKDIKDYYSL